MKAEEAIKQILESVKVLGELTQQVIYSSLAWWDEEEVKKAFRWAFYCQELVNKIVDMGAEFSSNLEQKMAEMSAKMNPPLPRPFSLSFLRHSLDVLMEIILHNATLPKALVPVMFQLVKSQYSRNVTQSLVTQLETSKIRESNEKAEDALQNLRMVLSSGQASPKAEVTAVRYLLEQLTFFLTASQRSVWFDMRLASILDRWTQCSRGWSVLVSSLCTDLHKVELEKRREMRRLLNVIVCWMVQQYRVHKRKCPLWLLSPAVLASLAEFNLNFFKWYLSELENIGDGLAKHNPLCSGRDSQGAGVGGGGSAAAMMEGWTLEQNDLEERLQQLLLRETSIKVEVLMMVLSKVKQDRASGLPFPVWSHIAKTLMKRNTEG